MPLTPDQQRKHTEQYVTTHPKVGEYIMGHPEGVQLSQMGRELGQILKQKPFSRERARQLYNAFASLHPDEQIPRKLDLAQSQKATWQRGRRGNEQSPQSMMLDEFIIAMRTQGLTEREIGEVVGLTEQTISRRVNILANRGRMEKREARGLTQATRRKLGEARRLIQEAIASGKKPNLTEIGKKVGIDIGNLSSLIRHGFQGRRINRAKDLQTDEQQ